MISNFWYINQKGTFKETRGARVGASEISQLFPNPEKPTESLAGYEQTALTLYHKKTGDKPPYIPSLAAEMGHFLENKSLELFIRQFFGKELATEFIEKKIIYEMREGENPEDYQVGLFRHNTEYYHDGMIVHPDLIYLGDPDIPEDEKKVTVNGITVDKSKPFYVESKSARKEATKRRNDSQVKGYDFDVTNHQGIPLKHYLQMQFQSAIFEIPVGYLSLLHNTSEFQVWRVEKDKKWQSRIINTVGKMLKHIEMKVPPKEMAICLSDIVSLYGSWKDDFISVSGEEAKKITRLCSVYNHANDQIKKWNAQKKDAQDALGVKLGNYSEIRCGSESLVKWGKKSASEKIGLEKEVKGKLSVLKWLKLNKKRVYNYLVRNDLILKTKESRSPSIKYKG